MVVDSNGVTSAASTIRGRVVAYMPQHPGSALNPARRIGAGLTELAKLHHPGADVVPEALRAAQLPADRATLRRFPHQFSGGQRQRIALAQALTCRPKVLVLDEPSTGLDSITRLQLVGELKDLADEGLGILLLSHDLDLVRELAHHVVVLSRGPGGRRSCFPRPPARTWPSSANQSQSRKAVAPGNEPVRVVAHSRPGTDPAGDRSRRPAGCLCRRGRPFRQRQDDPRALPGRAARAVRRPRSPSHGEDAPRPAEALPDQNRRVQYVWQEVRGSFDERRAWSTNKSPVPR